MAYLLGEKEFHGLALRVDARVLVPRPDTEALVEWALALLDAPPERVQQQQLGVEPVEARARGVAQGLRERGGAHAGRLDSSSASCSASRAARSAASTSPRSPSMMVCSL